MKTILKNIFITLLLTVLIVCSALPCLALSQMGKITVTLEDKEKNSINGITVHLCRIAELNGTGYYPTPDFETAGISISGIVNNPDETAAKALADYVKKNNLATLSKTSENGKISFTELELGIWLVFCYEEAYAFNPYVVFLPYESGGALCYEVSSSPKLEDGAQSKTDIHVIKKWDDKSNAAKKRPDAITVELLDGDTVVSSVELSAANGWSYTFSDVAKDGTYSVREKSIPDYKASYSGDQSNGFVVTNTYAGGKLPQTGQYWWPIVIIAVAGVCFISLGIYEMGAKKNGEKR